MEAREGTPHRKLNSSSQVPNYHPNLCTMPRHFLPQRNAIIPMECTCAPCAPIESRTPRPTQPTPNIAQARKTKRTAHHNKTALTLERTNTLAQVLTRSVHRATTFPLIIITIITYNRSRRIHACNPKPPRKKPLPSINISNYELAKLSAFLLLCVYSFLSEISKGLSAFLFLLHLVRFCRVSLSFLVLYLWVWARKEKVFRRWKEISQ